MAKETVKEKVKKFVAATGCEYVVELAGAFRPAPSRPGTGMVAKKKAEPVVSASESKLQALFETFKEEGEDHIGIEGTEKLCEALGVEPSDVVTLVLAWHLKCERMCDFRLPGWVEGWKKLGCDTLPKMKAAIPKIRKEIDDPAKFKEVYQYAFNFAKQEGQRSLVLETAVPFWQLLLTDRFKNLDIWVEYVTEHYKKSISKDTWNQAKFAREYKRPEPEPEKIEPEHIEAAASLPSPMTTDDDLLLPLTVEALWMSNDASAWRYALSQYPEAVKRFAAALKEPKRARFLELHEAVFTTIPTALKHRRYLTDDELQTITEYKQMRGKQRPNLSKNVAANAAADVEAVTKRAISLLPDHAADKDVTPLTTLLDALKILDKGDASHSVKGLKGVGPATAANILSLVDSSCPYFDDDLYLVAVGDPKPAYTLPGFEKLVEGVRAKADILGWDVRSVEKTIWARKVCCDHPTPEEKERARTHSKGVKRDRVKYDEGSDANGESPAKRARRSSKNESEVIEEAPAKRKASKKTK
ncbi:DCN1-like protein 2 [Irineochytrium annulatum]|nr:DCN1-like protein 2 [Irineochytrium annulatum]